MVKKTTKTLEGTTQLPWERGAQIWFIPVRQTLSKTVGFLQKKTTTKTNSRNQLAWLTLVAGFPIVKTTKSFGLDTLLAGQVF